MDSLRFALHSYPTLQARQGRSTDLDLWALVLPSPVTRPCNNFRLTPSPSDRSEGYVRRALAACLIVGVRGARISRLFRLFHARLATPAVHHGHRALFTVFCAGANARTYP